MSKVLNYDYIICPITGDKLQQININRIKMPRLTEAKWKVIVFEDRYYTPAQAFEELKQNVPV